MTSFEGPKSETDPGNVFDVSGAASKGGSESDDSAGLLAQKTTAIITVGSTAVEAVAPTEPWLLPTKGMVVAFGPNGELGNLASGFLEFLEEGQVSDGFLEEFDDVLLNSDRNHPAPLSPGTPAFVSLRNDAVTYIQSKSGGETGDHSLGAVVATTASLFGQKGHEDGPTFESAGDAAASALRLAAEKGLITISLPVLGSGSAGLDPQTTARETLISVVDELSRSPASALERVIIFDRSPAIITHLLSVAEELEAAPPPKQTQSRPAVLARMANDDPRGPDRLDITEDVRSLSRVIAAKSMTPPLSIGLLGDWGSGKSFFMQKMREEVRQLAEWSAEAQEAGEESSFCPQVSQITFNAWHYSDAELWPSLAARIFENLAGDDPEDRLEAARRARTAAPKKRERYFDELARLKLIQSDIQEAERDGDATSGLLDRVEHLFHSGPVRRAVLEASGAQSADFDYLRSNLNWNDDSVDSLRSFADDLDTAKGTWKQATRLAREGGKSRWLSILAVLTAALVLGGLVWLLNDPTVDWLGEGPFRWLENVVGFSPAAIAAVAGYLGVLRKPIALVREGAKKANNLIAALDDAESQRRHSLQEKRAEVEKQIGKLKADIEALDQTKKIQDFFSERHGSTKYRAHLGVISSLRQDFEDLVAILPKPEETDSQHRIILYIDDLDRCRRKLVVQVLEAIHLLLAFPLFVVVVAVDARWLLASLAEHYSMQLGRGDHDETSQLVAAHRESTPMNYLEKIFQVPYALQPMSRKGFQDLIGDLIRPSDPGTPRLAGPLVAPHESPPESDLPDPQAAQDGGSRVDTADGSSEAGDARDLDDGLNGADEETTRTEEQLVDPLAETSSQNDDRSLPELEAALDEAHTQSTVLLEEEQRIRRLETFPLEAAFEILGSLKTRARTEAIELVRGSDYPGLSYEKLSELVEEGWPRFSRDGESFLFRVASISLDLLLFRRRKRRRRQNAALALLDEYQALADVSLDGLRSKMEPNRELVGSLRSAIQVIRKESRSHVDLKPRALEIAESELNFMQSLAPMIHTPRSTKRLANVYRLIRAQLKSDELDAFTDETNGSPQYRGVLALLAILIGYPDQAAAIFEDLLNETRSRPQSGRWRDVTPGWAPKEDVTGNKHFNSLRQGMSEAESERWSELAATMGDVHVGGQRLNDDLLPEAKWVRVVARYSFRTGPLAELGFEMVNRQDPQPPRRKNISQYTTAELDSLVHQVMDQSDGSPEQVLLDATHALGFSRVGNRIREELMPRIEKASRATR